MRKMSAVLLFALLAVVCGASPVQAADPPVFAPPVPAMSSATQVGAGADSTRTDATHLMFFSHPVATGNFENNSIRIDSRDYTVHDIVATPGLLPPDDRIIDEGSLMLQGYRRSGVTMNPIHRFCPGTFELDGDDVTLDCQVGDAGDDDPALYESRQLQIADIRTAVEGELPLLPERDPVINAIIGSSHENISPYGAATYPATVMSRQKALATVACQCGYDPEYPERCRWNTYNTPTLAPYDEVVAYGIADLGAGVATAAYDTFFVTEKMRFNTGLPSDSPVRARFSELRLSSLPHTWPYMSPLAFFIKDTVSSRMKLDGYSASEIHTFFGGRTPRDYVLGFGIPLDMNINPIAVVSMKVDSSNGFAVVNQSTIVDLDAAVTLNGLPYPDPSDGSRHSWEDYFTLPDGSGIDATILPHRVVSYVTFWKEDESLRWGDAARFPSSFNPNSSFKAVGGALLGPGMFSAAKVIDTVDGVEKERLVVPSGEMAANSGYYLYKIDPQSEEKLQVRMDVAGVLNIGSEPSELQTVLAKPARVSLTPDGFAPYGIACGDLNRDGCGDCAITFRGANTLAIFPAVFTNAKGQYVRFQNGADPLDLAMFSDSVLVYYGRREGAECVFVEDESSLQMITVASQDIANPAQVASVAIGDVDGNGTDDLVVGDLVPRELSGRAGEYAAHAYLYLTGPDGLFVSLTSHQNVQVGFKTADGAVTANDLINIVKEIFVHGKVAGVAAIALDEYAEWGTNIGAINGIPLMLPKFGCPSNTNAEVFSLGEMLMSGAAYPDRCEMGGRIIIIPPEIPGPGDDGTGGSSIGGPGAQMTDPQPTEDGDTQFAYRVNFRDSNFPRDTGIKLAQLGGLPNTLGGISRSNIDLLRVSCVPGATSFDPLSVFDLPVPLGSMRTPRGQVMPGPREMTWVVKYIPEPPPAEETETPEPAEIPPSGPGPTTTGPGPAAMGDSPPAGPAAPGATTTTIPPPPPLEFRTVAFKNDCVARVLTYSSNEMKQKIMELNRDYIQKPTGRSDEIFVEPGQTMCFYCRFEDALTPEGVASLSTKGGSAIPALAGDVMPSVFVQTGGAELIDIRKNKYKTVNPLKQPQIIAPAGLEMGLGKSITARLPASSDEAFTNAVPMPIESMANLSGGGVMLNNMIEMRSYIAPIGESFTSDIGVTLESGVQGPLPDASELENKGAAILSYCITQPLDYATFTGLKGYTGAPNIEDRQLDVTVVADELAARAKDAPDGKPTIDVFYGVSWEDSLNIRHVAAMNTAGGVVTRKMASLEVAQGMFADSGGCKSCKNSITGLPPSLDSVLPTLVAILFAMTGLARSGKSKTCHKNDGETGQFSK